VYVNGTLASLTRFAGKTALPLNGERKQFNIGLQRGENLIEVVAKNAVGETRQTITVFLERQGQFDEPGDLYLLSVGVREYQNKQWSLNYADSDARDLYQRLTQLGKKLIKTFTVLC
jgi:hypothetical protein